MHKRTTVTITPIGGVGNGADSTLEGGVKTTDRFAIEKLTGNLPTACSLLHRTAVNLNAITLTHRVSMTIKRRIAGMVCVQVQVHYLRVQQKVL